MSLDKKIKMFQRQFNKSQTPFVQNIYAKMFTYEKNFHYLSNHFGIKKGVWLFTILYGAVFCKVQN